MDFQIDIAVTDRKDSLKYKNQTRTWAWLEEKNSHPIRTTETAEEYPKLSKTKRDELKDHGGCVPAMLRQGSRKIKNVIALSFGMADADHIPDDVNFPEQVQAVLPDTLWHTYTTHSHTPENQRYRLVVAFSRKVKPDEYPPVMRKLAQKIGIEYFDPCSYEVNRMMYWPSCPENGVFDFQKNDGEPLDIDSILAEYDDWRDVSQWPSGATESEVAQRDIKQQQNPLSKNDWVGAFCKTYSIESVVEKYLPDVYEPSAIEGRYQLKSADSLAGLIIYENGKFAFSHHASDPAAGKLCNAFDLVRLHKFSELDDKKSFTAMRDLAMQDEDVKLVIAQERLSQASEDFKDSNWQKQLEYEPRSTVLKNTLGNLLLILNNDEALQGIRYNRLANQMFGDSLPWDRPFPSWRDADTAQLVAYIENHYGTFTARNFELALTKVSDDRSYHPILDYLEALPPWDGVKRAETLLIDYLGAEDTPYVRTVTRKTIAAAVARVKNPGVKFDTVLVISGSQGIGKSTLLFKLGGKWYSDSLSISDMKDKTAPEKLQGNWVLELSELAGLKKVEVETVKSFASRTDDKYRPSFGRTVESHPRQCIIIGTTNSEDGFLRDITGNRRFWPVRTYGNSKYKPWDLTQETADQIWAEAIKIYDAGEELYLKGEVADAAALAQQNAMESDEREGLVRKYLDTLLPETWESMDIYNRREYIHSPNDPTQPVGVNRRDTVSNIEIWTECFGKRQEEIKPIESYAIAAIMVRIESWEKTGKLVTLPLYGRQRIYERK